MRCHFTTPVQTRRQPRWTVFLEHSFGAHQNEIHRLLRNDKNRLTHILVHTTKDQISEAVVGIVVFASVSSDQWIEIPAGPHAVAVLMGHVRYGQIASPSCMRQGKQEKRHGGTTHGSLEHRIGEVMHTGQSGPIGPISKGV